MSNVSNPLDVLRRFVRPARQRSRFVLAVVAAAAIFAVAGLATRIQAQGDVNQPVDFSHNVLNAPAPVAGTVFGSGPALHSGDVICTTPVSNDPNVNTDCEKKGPSNETSLAVNPTNESNIIGGANDYQLAANPGGHVTESILSRAHVTFDGGRSWTSYPILFNSAYQATGDPAVAFDAAGRAYYATLGFKFVGPTNGLNPDVLVANSTDGGKTWTSTRVAAGSGTYRSVGDFLDKEYIAAWGDGNAIVTYGDFRQLQFGSFATAKIYATVTHDGGATWSAPQVISGDLNEAFASVPTVAADGRIYVAFLNTTDLTTFRDDYEFVEVDPQTGARIYGPVKVATTIDGATDYPIAFGRQTYQNSLFRSWAAGNITSDPTNPAHLAIAWSDMRNSQTPAPTDPYTAVTNSDVVVSQSFNNGHTWSAPVALEIAGDQFMPWAAFDSTGRLRIGFFDRQYDASNRKYGFTLATEDSLGVLSFSSTQLTTTLSDPTTGNRWFARTVNKDFPFATAFLGDYANIAARPSGGVVALWTDLRETACFGSRCGAWQDAYFAAAR